jgi:3D (Asp-Asp-Asp) domain-containing protein
MSKFANILLIFCLALVGYFWRQDVTRLESSLASAEKSSYVYRLELEKARDEGSLLRAVVQANLSKIADPVPNKMLTVTAYTAEELTQQPGEQLFTASSLKPHEGMVAVSRDLFNQGWVFGKKIYIKNHGVFTITDLMAQRKTKSVDIYMNDQGRATEFGKRQVEVVLLDV